VTGNLAVDRLIAQMTVHEEVTMLTGAPDPQQRGEAGYVPGVPRLGIPALRLADGQDGVNSNTDTTLLPSPLGLASTFSTTAAGQYGDVIGKDARATDINVMLSTHINIDRDPIGGRNDQTFGEDPYLVGQLAANEVRGIQSNGVIAQAKHYLVAGSNVTVDESTLEEIYLPAFEAVVKAGVGSIMCEGSTTNGENECDSPTELSAMLRGQLGFTGFVGSDWGANPSTTSINSGMDMDMPGYAAYGGFFTPRFGSKLEAAVENGSVAKATLDKAVGAVLTVEDRLGMLKPHRGTPKLDKIGDAKVARSIGDQAGVLLKDTDSALPLSASALSSVAVIGPTAGQLAAGYGQEGSYGFADREISPLQALQSEAGPGAHFTYSVGDDLTGTPIPASALTPESGTGQGLTRVQSTLSDGPTNPITPIPGATPTVDPQINFTGTRALPAKKAWTWTGTLNAPTTGTYQLMLQTGTTTTGDAQNTPFNVGAITVDGNPVASGSRIELNGGRARAWSDIVPTTDGLDNARGTVTLTAGQHAIKVVAQSIGNNPLQVRLNWVTPDQQAANYAAAAAAAAKAKTAIVFAYSKGGSGLTMPEQQDALISAVAAANPNTIVVLNSGNPVTMPWLANVKAVLEMWYPGQEGGWSTADLLLGKADPSGKLPITFPTSLDQTPVYDPAHPERSVGVNVTSATGTVTHTVVYSEGIQIGYRWYDANNVTPLFPFGYGLSYTDFAYSGLSARGGASGLDVSFIVKNTGSVAGAESAQVYLGSPATVPPGAQIAKNALVGFDRVSLQPHASKRITVHISQRQLSYWATGLGWTVATGDRTVSAGSSSRTLPLEQTVTIP
jgi:beta-glucosidase